MSIAKRAEHYIASRPAIKECLRRGVINYTALAREIQSTCAIDSIVPIVAAIRRYKKHLANPVSSDSAIAKALRSTRVRYQARLSLVIITRPKNAQAHYEFVRAIRSAGNIAHYIEGEERAILIYPSHESRLLKKSCSMQVLETFEHIGQITLTQSLAVMTTKGVAARLFGLLAQEGISIVESIMCGGEHLLFVQEKDLEKILTLVHSGYIGGSAKV
jgi:hypothetical protein